MTGFCDGESCFYVKVAKKNSYILGYAVTCVFSISLHIKDVEILRHIKAYFKVGFLTVNPRIHKCSYKVGSLEDISNIIIPHFERYPLKTQKFSDFKLWKNTVDIIISKKHLNIEGLQEILNNKANINWGLNKRLLEEFPLTQAVPRPSVPDSINLDPN